MLIGLTGRNASGKTTVIDWFVERGWKCGSCSDAIRHWLREQGREITRESLTEGGRTLRREGGGGILAEMLLERIEPDERTIIDSIRTPDEVRAFRQREGFLLVEVRAPAADRWRRMQGRGRSGDPVDEAAFLAQERAEEEAVDSAGQALRATAALADVVIENDGDAAALVSALELLEEVLPDLAEDVYGNE